MRSLLKFNVAPPWSVSSACETLAPSTRPSSTRRNIGAALCKGFADVREEPLPTTTVDNTCGSSLQHLPLWQRIGVPCVTPSAVHIDDEADRDREPGRDEVLPPAKQAPIALHHRHPGDREHDQRDGK